MNREVDIRDPRGRFSSAGSVEDGTELVDHPIDAGLIILANLEPPQVFANFGPDCVARLCRRNPIVDRLRELAERERDQDAEHDDPDLSGELAPAMQRLWKMDANAVDPRRLRQRNRRSYVRNAREQLRQEWVESCRRSLAKFQAEIGWRKPWGITS
jgi:hypothetical protein